MSVGTVKWFDPQTECGSIIRDEDGKEISVLRSGLEMDDDEVLDIFPLYPGQKVEMEVTSESEGFLMAVDIWDPDGSK